jgi:diadenosine tetraphosphatase ApaH/serine/threonine PP2A family protein phosphatase
VENLELVDWDSLQIVETHDDEGRIEIISEDHMCELLGLRRETTTGPSHTFECQMDEQCVDGADTPISDGIPSEMVI